MNKKQIAQLFVGVACIVLIILWLSLPGWGAGKVLGIISALLLILSVVLSFIAEEKNKKK